MRSYVLNGYRRAPNYMAFLPHEQNHAGGGAAPPSAPPPPSGGGGSSLGSTLSVGLAAAGTAIAPGIGTAIGAALGSIIGNMFGGGPSIWANAGQGVHDWFTPYGEEAFLQWMLANHPEAFSSLDKVKAFRYLWAYGNDGGDVNNTLTSHYMLSGGAPAMQDLFLAMGIDLASSQQSAVDNGGSPNNIRSTWVVFAVPGGPQTVGLDRVDQAAQNALDGNASAEDQALLDAAANGDDSGGSPIVPLLVIGGIVLAFSN